MKVVAFNGSPRKDGNTAIMIRRVFAELEKEGIETELVQLAGQAILVPFPKRFYDFCFA
jgi:multimeric flavodoxin WrbA